MCCERCGPTSNAERRVKRSERHANRTHVARPRTEPLLLLTIANAAVAANPKLARSLAVIYNVNRYGKGE